MNNNTNINSRIALLFPAIFRKHYIIPFLVKGERRPYDAKDFFDGYYGSVEGEGISDAATIAPDKDKALARHHYNAAENNIIEALLPMGVANSASVLDVGSGAGHWIDFYIELFGAEHVTGCELSEVCADKLRRKYAGDGRVEIVMADVSAEDFETARSHDLVNAVGVMFHIVDDAAWERAVKNLAASLAPGGTMVVGGWFGPFTRDVQFFGGDGKTVMVNKRIRSLRKWRKAARAAGLRVVAVKKSRMPRWMINPENNVLLLAKDR